ncbi:MAG: sugar ABC transporter permease [Lachnospiraceae bacterium]|nr:sugar ABC transporter permease [Lachnospiraceae bacterium]
MRIKGFKQIIINKKTMPYLLLLPAFLFIGAFMLYPIGNTVVMSMQHNVMIDPGGVRFVGVENFKTLLLHDEVFHLALKNSLVWVLGNVFFQSTLGMALALILNQNMKCRGFIRAITFSPWAVSGVIVSLMWSFMYSESVGVFNDIMLKLGIIDSRISWFSTGSRAMLAMIIATTWRGIPFFAINFLSSLQTISEDMYESARVDGAGALKRFFYITMPMMKDTVVLTLLLRTIWTLNIVDIIYSTTAGGPANTTLTVPVYIMNTFMGSLDYGYTSAMAVIMAVIMIVFALAFIKITKYGKESLY